MIWPRGNQLMYFYITFDFSFVMESTIEPIIFR